MAKRIPDKDIIKLASIGRCSEAFDDACREKPPAPLRQGLCVHAHPCYLNALKGMGRGFAMGYCVRGALVLLFGLVAKRLYKKPRKLLAILSKPELVRTGLFIGLLSGSFKSVDCLMRQIRKKEDSVNPVVAGAVSSLSLIAAPASDRTTVALYIFARAWEAVLRNMTRQGVIPRIPHSDFIAFAICSAQIMYSYVMAPETLPKSYYKFIVKMGPIDESILHAVSDNSYGLPHRLGELAPYCNKHNIPIPDASTVAVNCEYLHPGSGCGPIHWSNVFTDVCRKSFPLYGTIHLLPKLVFKPLQIFKRPTTLISKVLFGTMRSCAFLGSFVSIYQAAICATNAMYSKSPFRAKYWLCGIIAGLGIFVEQKSRRQELALYIIPRALDNLWRNGVRKGRLVDLQYGNVMVFTAAMSALMYCYRKDATLISNPYRRIVQEIFRD